MISIFQSKDHRWRDAYNPLRGLSLPKLVGLLEAGERGQYADLQWLYYFMERSDSMIFAVAQRRLAALMSVDWDVRVSAQVDGSRLRVAGYGAEDGPPSPHGGLRRGDPAGAGSEDVADAVLAEEQAAVLREAYDGIENFRDAVAFMFTGFFRGYAHLEKHLAPSGMIDRLEPVEQWFWVRDGMFGEWQYNENAVSGRLRGQAVERGNFVVLETPALNRILSVLFLRKNLSQKDWDSFLEVYGIPSIFLVGPPGASEAKEEEYQQIAEQIISDGRGFLPNGSDLKYVNGGGGKPPFKDHIEYIDRQITLVGTGGLLTMLAESGSGTLAGSAHSETFMQIARGDAVSLSAVFQRDIDGPLLEAYFPGWPQLAYFEFAPGASDAASKVVQDAVQLAGAGYPMEPAELSEKTGYRLVEPVA